MGTRKFRHHEWRYSRLDSQQRALMLYQGNQRRFWHATIGGPQAFNLSIINNEVLADTHSHLMIRVNNEQYKLIRKSCPHPALRAPLNFTFHYRHYAVITTRPLVLSIRTPPTRVHWLSPYACPSCVHWYLHMHIHHVSTGSSTRLLLLIMHRL